MEVGFCFIFMIIAGSNLELNSSIIDSFSQILKRKFIILKPDLLVPMQWTKGLILQNQMTFILIFVENCLLCYAIHDFSVCLRTGSSYRIFIGFEAKLKSILVFKKNRANHVH